MVSELLTHRSMLIIFIDYSKILMYSSFCFWSCRLYSFPELFRSLPFPLTHFSEIVSYVCNTVRVIWSDGFLEEKNGKMKTQPSGNWVRKSLWTIFLYIPNVWWLHAVGWPNSCHLFSLCLFFFLPICSGLNVCIPVKCKCCSPNPLEVRLLGSNLD